MGGTLSALCCEFEMKGRIQNMFSKGFSTAMCDAARQAVNYGWYTVCPLL